MAGSSMEIRANLVDTNYIPMRARWTWTPLTAHRGNVFTAPDGGEVTITGRPAAAGSSPSRGGDAG